MLSEGAWTAEVVSLAAAAKLVNVLTISSAPFERGRNRCKIVREVGKAEKRALITRVRNWRRNAGGTLDLSGPASLRLLASALSCRFFAHPCSIQTHGPPVWDEEEESQTLSLSSTWRMCSSISCAILWARSSNSSPQRIKTSDFASIFSQLDEHCSGLCRSPAFMASSPH